MFGVIISIDYISNSLMGIGKLLNMKFLFDLFPVVLFFIFYKIFDIYVATAALMAATYIQIILLYLFKKKIEKMIIFTAIVITVFGGMTLFFQSNVFIMWKPSIIYWVFGLVILVANKFYNKNLIQMSLGNQVELKKQYWQNLSWSTALFFIFLGFLNIYIAQNFSEDTWVSFKLFGMTALLFLYIISVTIYIAKVNKS
jgi:intracellular septation protein